MCYEHYHVLPYRHCCFIYCIPCLCYGHCCFLFLYAISYYTLLLILCTACIYGQYCLIYLVFIAVLCIVFYSCWHCHIAFPSLYDVTLSLTTSFILIAANLTGWISLSMAIRSRLHIGPTYKLLLYVMNYIWWFIATACNLLRAVGIAYLWSVAKVWRKIGLLRAVSIAYLWSVAKVWRKIGLLRAVGIAYLWSVAKV